jgi:nitroimidazol reductase NimA-like FMN-containing flavoprotein (pyridoxamine 5'-phosphate oxidase superfamily)
MPGYGIRPPGEGTGLLPWSWALERLIRSRYYWVCTAGPDHRPHATPVWAVWHEECVWFSCAPRSRKARNLNADPHCTVATDDASSPVIVEGVARRVSDRAAIDAVRSDMVAKYDYELTLDFLLANVVFAVAPVKVIGLVEDDFTGSPTRWSAVD